MIDRLIHFLLYRLHGPEFAAGTAATAASFWLGHRLNQGARNA